MWRCDPPQVTFRVANSVFALAVLLVARLVRDHSARRAGLPEVVIDISHLDDNPARRPSAGRWQQVAAHIQRVQPDAVVADWTAFDIVLSYEYRIDASSEAAAASNRTSPVSGRRKRSLSTPSLPFVPARS